LLLASGRVRARRAASSAGGVLVGLTGQAFTSGGGFGAAFAAFVVAAAVLVVLMFALALLLATAQERTVRSMREGAPAVKRWGGRILVAVGAWLVVLAAFAHFFARVFPV
jgi:hypothetical protein